MRILKRITARLMASLGMAALLLWVTAAQAQGGGVAQLQRFVEHTRHASGAFEQTVEAASGRRPQTASGSFVFARPGKFRWQYETPYAQLLVSDGLRLWSWDEDLNQVTVQALGDALGNTPAAVIAGDGDLERSFELVEAGSSDGLEWVLATPRQTDSMFESVRLGLSDNVLRRMEMRDNFGQRTVIEFSGFDASVNPSADAFDFVPPPGADVIQN